MHCPHLFAIFAVFQKLENTGMNASDITGKTIRFLKNWTLPVAIAAGILSYLIYDSIPSVSFAGPYLEKTIGVLQPLLLFMMLFLYSWHLLRS